MSDELRDLIRPDYKQSQKKRGRKSLQEERARVLWHENAWMDDCDVEALENKIKTKRYSGQDMAKLMLLKGNKTIVARFMDKMIPDLHQHEVGGTVVGDFVLNIVKFNGDNSSLQLPAPGLPNTTPPGDG